VRVLIVNDVKDVYQAMAFNPFEFLQETRSEVAKISWPTRNETILTTVFVIIMVLLAGLFLFAVDQTLSFLINRILSFSA
jgi:preprotein translocase subunit SecE